MKQILPKHQLYHREQLFIFHVFHIFVHTRYNMYISVYLNQRNTDSRVTLTWMPCDFVVVALSMCASNEGS